MSLEPTGERFLPSQWGGELVHAEHLARYRLAAQVAKNRKVLDVACGEGYGSALLAGAGPESVTGVDIDPDTVEHVRAVHRVEAKVADIRELPFADGAFDLVVSFETIEHVEEPERALDELARVRADGGLLLISTPVAGQYKVDNEFHVREFGHNEFVAMLEARFPSVGLLYQHNWLMSAILDEKDLGQQDGVEPLDVDLTKVRGIAPGHELYLLAVCGEKSEVGLRQVAVTAGTDEAHDLAHRLADAVRTQEHYLREHEKVSALLADAVAVKESLLASPSWRLTAPVRALGRLRRAR